MARIGRPQEQVLTLNDIERDEHERLGRSQSASHNEERIASLLCTVLESKPVGATHWTVRSAAAESGLSKSTVARMLTLERWFALITQRQIRRGSFVSARIW